MKYWLKYLHSYNYKDNLGCELLAERIEVILPQLHVLGHIHSGYGYEFKNDTHFFNTSVLNEQYEYT